MAVVDGWGRGVGPTGGDAGLWAAGRGSGGEGGGAHTAKRQETSSERISRDWLKGLPLPRGHILC